jgi:hypothetical protein
MKTRLTLITLMLTFALMPGAGAIAQTECFVTGAITAEVNTDPGYPGWKYTAVISWDTGSVYALSHLDMILDSSSGTCSCDDLANDLVFAGILGTSNGDPADCEVEYETFLECDGDPSIPGDEGIIFKFEPIEGDCEPGTTGTGTFAFYSDLGPAPIDEELLSLIDKFGQLTCSGYLTGQFPSLACDPVSNGANTWDAVKGLFR